MNIQNLSNPNNTTISITSEPSSYNSKLILGMVPRSERFKFPMCFGVSLSLESPGGQRGKHMWGHESRRTTSQFESKQLMWNQVNKGWTKGFNILKCKSVLWSTPPGEIRAQIGHSQLNAHIMLVLILLNRLLHWQSGSPIWISQQSCTNKFVNPPYDRQTS